MTGSSRKFCARARRAANWRRTRASRTNAQRVGNRDDAGAAHRRAAPRRRAATSCWRRWKRRACRPGRSTRVADVFADPQVDRPRHAGRPAAARRQRRLRSRRALADRDRRRAAVAERPARDAQARIRPRCWRTRPGAQRANEIERAPAARSWSISSRCTASTISSACRARAISRCSTRLHDAPIAVTVCRQEGGAAMMAEAYGKLTGRPGICFVTRGPGATNASPGMHIAQQDSTPLILFVGQIERGMREREAFQELDYRAVFGSIAKWVTEIDDPARIPEIVSRAFHVATSGPPGPGGDRAAGGHADRDGGGRGRAAAMRRSRLIRAATRWPNCRSCSWAAKRPIAILGGSRWSAKAVRGFRALRRALRAAGRLLVPPADAVPGRPSVLCRRSRHRRRIRSCWRASRKPTSSCSSARGCRKSQPELHAARHPEPGRHAGARPCRCRANSGRVYRAASRHQRLAGRLLRGARRPAAAAARSRGRGARRRRMPTISPGATRRRSASPGALQMGEVMAHLRESAAGRHDLLQRRRQLRHLGAPLLAVPRATARSSRPTSGSMGYGVPAGGRREAHLAGAHRRRASPATADFLMNGQEFATAVQYDLPIIVIVVDNGMYGTIRMHQERHYPGRVSATT